jgi:DNA-binding MarR family transcriptional regulator
MSSEQDRLERDQLIAALVQALRRQSGETIMLHQGIADRLGLNTTDHKCLDIIVMSEPMTAGRLAELTGLTTGAVTGVIDRLEKAGYVKRAMDPNDRRRVIIQPLEEKAKQEIGPLFDSLAQATARLLSRYSDQELAFLLDFLTRINELTREEAQKLRSTNRKKGS